MHDQAAVVLMVIEQDCYLCTLIHFAATHVDAHYLLLVFCIFILPVDLLSTN